MTRPRRAVPPECAGVCALQSPTVPVAVRMLVFAAARLDASVSLEPGFLVLGLTAARKIAFLGQALGFLAFEASRGPPSTRSCFSGLWRPRVHLCFWRA